VPHRDHIAASGEDVRLAELHLAVDQLRGAQRDENRLAVDLQLGALMRVERILDRKIVQAEPLLHRAQQFLGRPHAARPRGNRRWCRPGRPDRDRHRRAAARPHRQRN